MAKKRKPCKRCGGKKAEHTPRCAVYQALDAPCDCGPPKCPECGGTGIRERHKDKAVREVMES